MRKPHRSLAMVGGMAALGAATFASAARAFATDVPQKEDMGKEFQDGKKVLVDWLKHGTPEFAKFLRVTCARASDDANVSRGLLVNFPTESVIEPCIHPDSG